MSEWAMVKDGRIVDVITTGLSQAELQKRHPHYEIADLYSLPSDVQQAYQYWDDRP